MVYGEYLAKTRGIFQFISASDFGSFTYNGSPLSFFDSYVLPFFLFSVFISFRLYSDVPISDFRLSCPSPFLPLPIALSDSPAVKVKYHLLHPISSPLYDILQVWVYLITSSHSNFFVANEVPSRRPSWSDPHVTSPWQQADKSTSPMTGNRQQCLSVTDVSIRECESTQWRLDPV